MTRHNFVLPLILSLVVGLPPASGQPVPLSSLDLTNVIVGWGSPQANRSVDGNPLRIAGRTYDSGVGVHAASHIRVQLGLKAESFHAWVGLDDEKTIGTVNFQVAVDGTTVWTSGRMKAGDAAREVRVPLTGAKQLDLIVDDGGDNINHDHADWASAVIQADEIAIIRTVPVLTEKRFPHPDRIRYDGHCMQLEGRDVFIYSAAFHYFRCPRELWRARFQAIREAGFNTVETYTPWNWHEREMPTNPTDTSKLDLTELEAWLDMAQDEFGLYTIVRPGPFICAEWAGGGYPRWLAKFGPGGGGLWLRGGDDTHIAWCLHWYDAVCKLFAREQITNKPRGAKGIILVQIENEYNAHGCDGKVKFLQALYDAVVRAGVDVPVFTCLTSECRNSRDGKLSQVFDCDNYYVGLTEAPGCAHRMAALRGQQPNAPGFVTELQGGWFSTIGGSPSETSHSDARHFNAIHWMSLLGGATGLNPYMFSGGTHFGNWGSRGQTTTYDYNAAIREWGSRSPKYAVAQGVARFIRENEAQLVRAEGGPCALQGAPKSLFGGVRISPDGTRFVFLHHTDPAKPAAGKVTLVPGGITRAEGPLFNIDQNGNKVLIQPEAGTSMKTNTIAPFEVSYDLAPLGAMALVIPPGKSPAEGVWYPKPQPPIVRPSLLPAPVRIASVLRRDEDFAARWQPLPTGRSLPELGVGDQRYALYRARFTLSPSAAAAQNHLLIRSFSRDIITVQINGKLPKRTHPSDAYASSAHRNLSTSNSRIGPNDFDNRFNAAGLLHVGDNEIIFLYENIGHEHGYVPMEELCGIVSAGLGETDHAVNTPLTLEVATDLGGIFNGWHQPETSTNGWSRLDLDCNSPIPRSGNGIQPKGTADALLTWFRLEFKLPAAEPRIFIPWALRIQAAGNGEMYLNGHNIGRHWEAGPQREFYLPECWLRFGRGQINILTVGLRQTINGAVIKAAEIAPYPDAAEIRQ